MVKNNLRYWQVENSLIQPFVQGVTFKNMPVRDISGNPVEFDFSGFPVTAGISILL